MGIYSHRIAATALLACAILAPVACSDSEGDTPSGLGGGGSSAGGARTTGGTAQIEGGSTASLAGSGGAGGEDSTAGGTAAGGSAGDSGSAGTATAGAPPCDGSCMGATPVCNVVSNSCVQCQTNTHCTELDPADGAAGGPGLTPFCKANTNTCVECLKSADCGAPNPFCDTETNTCVPCLSNADCTDAKAPRCDTRTHTCETCKQSSDCTGIKDKSVCAEDGECVQCTHEDFTSCGSEAGTPFVCDSKLRSCTKFKKGSAGICQPCVGDAQCSPGRLCVEDEVTTSAGPVSLGYFCQWKKGDTTNGAPASCGAAPPFVGTATAATSADGAVADICVLRSSSCKAYTDYSSKNCGQEGAANDSLCGAAAPVDGVCRQFDETTFFCTMPCGGNIDCKPGKTCVDDVCSF